MTAHPGPTSGDRAVSLRIELAKESDFQLGRSCVKPSVREVVSESGTEILEPRVMQVLIALYRQAGQVLTRDELVERCWAGRVVGEDAIQRCITKVRRLSETHGGFTIQTIARVGYRLTLDAHADPAAPPDEPRTTSRKSRTAIAGALVVVLAIASTLGVIHWLERGEARARLDHALAEIEKRVNEDELGAAFSAAYPLSREAPVRADPRFQELWNKIVIPMRPLVSERGATVYFKPYDASGDWILAGTTPFDVWIEAPRAPLRIKVAKPGFRTGYFTVAVPGPSVQTQHATRFSNLSGAPIPLPLAPDGSMPQDMVLVPRTNVPVYLRGWISELFGGERHDIPAFAIGRHEVTNREFKEFVDAGGYDEPKYWTGLAFTERGRALSWNEVRARFVDATHRPGPAGWQLSTYPRDQADAPVGGISWYEAMAYARFRGQTLPTIHHWMRAAFTPIDAVFQTAPAIATASRFRASAPASALGDIGTGPWGTQQMFGNVREWVLNFAGSEAVALGGAWPQYPPESSAIFVADPMNRAPEHGLRLMRTLSESPIDPALLQPIRLVRDTESVKREPVSDDAFEAMRFQFDKAKVEPVGVKKREVRRSALYSVEEVVLTFAAEPATTLYIVRPNVPRGQRLQTIVFGPGGSCCFAKRPNLESLENLVDTDFIPNAGRVLVIPIWAGSYERFAPVPLTAAEQRDRERRAAFAWHHDLTATLNYLESLPEIDPSRFGYLGYSRGATFSGVLLAVENRIKAAVFVASGVFLSGQIHPMIDIVNYAPRIEVPLLILNGRYDHHHPLEESQLRLFQLIGTPPEHKQLETYDSGHFALQGNVLISDISNWFDKYLGPPR